MRKEYEESKSENKSLVKKLEEMQNKINSSAGRTFLQIRRKTCNKTKCLEIIRNILTKNLQIRSSNKMICFQIRRTTGIPILRFL